MKLRLIKFRNSVIEPFEEQTKSFIDSVCPMYNKAQFYTRLNHEQLSFDRELKRLSTPLMFKPSSLKALVSYCH